VLYTDISDRLHVSGHGSMGDLSLMMSLVRPKFVLPIGGTYKHMIAYKALAKKNGFEDRNIILPDDGQEILFTKTGMSYGKKIQIQNVYVDQVSGEEVDTFVLRDREKISKEGVVIVLCEIDSYGTLADRPNIIVRGFSGAEVNEMMNGLSLEIKNNLKPKKSKVTDWNYVRKSIGNIAERFMIQKLKRRPLVLPVVIEV
jgi:ribonuclease J